MHISYTAHNSTLNVSSSPVIEYLDKENKLNNNNDEYLKHDGFFGSEFSNTNTELNILPSEIINNLDNNRGTIKLKESNFFMLNVSPSLEERNHIEKIAMEELDRRGILNTPKNELSYNLHKEELIKIQYKLYTKDIVSEYASHFNREIYVDESKVPNQLEHLKISAEVKIEYDRFLRSKNINLNENIVEENKSREYKNISDLKIIEKKGNSVLIEFTNDNLQKSEVFVPEKLLFEQKDGTHKMPLDLYIEKSKEIDSKNKFIEIEGKFIDSKIQKINKEDVKVLTFERKDERLKAPITLSFSEKDITVKDGKFLVNQHLFNQRYAQRFDLAVKKEFGAEKDKIYNRIASSKGYDLSKRPLEEKDLLWYAKIETNRKYKHTDVAVKINKEIFAKIKEIEKQNPIFKHSKIEKLKEGLIKDSSNKEIIREGNYKGGSQHHIHIVVSRHDKTMQNPRNKISISPLSNHISEDMPRGGKSGFHRDSFAQKTQEIFDSKFDFKRTAAQEYSTHKSNKIESTIKGQAKGELKNFINKHIGLNSIKKELNPIQSIKEQLPLAQIPSNIPKHPIDLAIKIVKKIITQSEGIGY